MGAPPLTSPRRPCGVAVAAALLLAGCGGESAPSPEEIAECLRAGGAAVELDPPLYDRPSPKWAPALTPGTEVAATGALGDATIVHVFVAPEGEADRAEERALEFLRLFGLGRDDLVRRGDTLLMLRYTVGADSQRRDRELARRCMEDPGG